jgi:hypothetical protein
MRYPAEKYTLVIFERKASSESKFLLIVGANIQPVKTQNIPHTGDKNCSVRLVAAA